MLHMAAFLEVRNCAEVGLDVSCLQWVFCHSPRSWPKFWQNAKPVIDWIVEPTQLSKQQEWQQIILQQDNPATARACQAESSWNIKDRTNCSQLSSNVPWQINCLLALPSFAYAVSVIRTWSGSERSHAGGSHQWWCKTRWFMQR